MLTEELYSALNPEEETEIPEENDLDEKTKEEEEGEEDLEEDGSVETGE